MSSSYLGLTHGNAQGSHLTGQLLEDPLMLHYNYDSHQSLSIPSPTPNNGYSQSDEDKNQSDVDSDSDFDQSQDLRLQDEVTKLSQVSSSKSTKYQLWGAVFK
jgi:hypothetical protein